jgi:hypothetical protein
MGARKGPSAVITLTAVVLSLCLTAGEARS